MPENDLVYQVVLQNDHPGHNKYYEINVVRDGVGKYAVFARWGRIENFESDSAQSQFKLRKVSRERAQSSLERLRYAKSSRGYQHLETVDVAANTARRKARKKKSKKSVIETSSIDRTRTELPDINSWFQGSISIESRKV